MELRIPTKTLEKPDYNVERPEKAGDDWERPKILPQELDPADIRIEGTVTAIDGDTAVVQVRFANGTRVGETAAPPADDELSDDALAKAAADADAAAFEEEM